MDSKGNHKENEKLTEWEKIFANNAANKELISKIHKQLLQVNIKKTNPIKKKMVKRAKQTFF